MLAKRLIPCLDVDRGRVVKGVQFVSLRDAGDPVECAVRLRHRRRGRARLSRHHGQLGCAADRARHGAPRRRRGLPPVHGGRRRAFGEDADELLRAGADKVAVNTAAVRDPEILTRNLAALRFAGHRLAIDARSWPAGGWEVYVRGGRTPTGIDALEWARDAEARGAGEILLTSMDKDGTRTGSTWRGRRPSRRRCGIPVIASGGLR